MKTPFSSARLLILAVFFAVACSAGAREFALIRTNFVRTGLDADVRGTARAVFTPNNPKFRIDIFGLTPEAECTFTVDGVLEETFFATNRGRAHLDFRPTPGGFKRLLDFDPRNSVLAVSDGTGDILTVVFSGEGEPENFFIDERTDLLRATGESRGRVALRYVEQRNKDRFFVHLLGMNRGIYQLFVDGELQTEIHLRTRRSALRTFELLKNPSAKPGAGINNQLPLDFDPRGLLVELVRDGTVVFSGEMLAKIPSLGGPQVGEANLVLTPGEIVPGATGSALIRLNAEGELSLRVQVGALPAGTYDVVIDGVVRGTITVTGEEPDGLAVVTFSTAAEAELLLDFALFGKSLQVSQGETVFLSGTLALALTESAP